MTAPTFAPPGKDPGDAAALLREALGAQQSGRPAEAFAIYGRVLRKSPNDPDALNLSGAFALSQGETDTAI